MYARNVDNKELTFDFAEGLVKDNLLIVDRETKSIWSQLDGKAIDGPLKGKPLQLLASMQTTWKHWRELHPKTRVWVVKDSKGRPYFYRNWRPGQPRPKKRPRSHDVSNLGLGLALGNVSIYFPFKELEKVEVPFEIEIAGKKVKVYYRKDAMTAWAEDEAGNLLRGVLSYQDGWLGFHPESRIFKAK